MTREERENAIKVIKNYDLNFFDVNKALFSPEEIANAFDCALEALEQKPCEDMEKEYEKAKALFSKVVKSEDCISRQAAIKNVAQIAKVAAKSDKQKSLCGRIIFMLEHMSEVSE